MKERTKSVAGLRPLSISEAAQYARVPGDQIRWAMKAGRLMWKRLGSDPSTTRGWVEEWLNG